MKNKGNHVFLDFIFYDNDLNECSKYPKINCINYATHKRFLYDDDKITSS